MIDCFSNVCADLEVPIADEKSVGPTTVLVFLGLELDSVNMLIRVPQQKIYQLFDMLKDILKHKKITLRDMESLVGMLNFFGKAIRSSRAFLRRFYDAMIGV